MKTSKRIIVRSAELLCFQNTTWNPTDSPDWDSKPQSLVFIFSKIFRCLAARIAGKVEQGKQPMYAACAKTNS